MVNFFDKPIESKLTNEFKFPNNCDNDCDYIVKWSVQNAMLEMTVHSKAEGDEWVGVGFSTNSIMVSHYYIPQLAQNFFRPIFLN